MCQQYAAGSWGAPPDSQPMVNTLIAACAREEHLLVVAFPVTGIPEPVMRKLVQQRPRISSLPQPLLPPPTHDVEARQNQQGAHIRLPPAQQHEQNLPPAMHPVEPNWPQYGAPVSYWTNTQAGVAQPNHIIPGMTRMGYAVEEGSDPNMPGPSESHVGGPSAGVNAGYGMNLDRSQGGLNNVQYYAGISGWTTEGADYRDNHYGYSQ
jgi:hypothetical protein